MDNKDIFIGIDSNILELVKVINSFSGIVIVSCCGGHSFKELNNIEVPNKTKRLKRNTQSYFHLKYSEGNWYITFKVLHNERGWISLEFITWLINNESHKWLYSNYSNKDYYPILRLFPNSAPPYLNIPGKTLEFILEGCNIDSNEVADWIKMKKEKFYVSNLK